MIFTETELKGAFIIDFKGFEDERGFFGRIWCKKEFEEHGLNANAVQANVSYSRYKGTIRGMHYQIAPHEETKTLRCTFGSTYNVIIDLRPKSPTFKRWTAVELTADSYRMLYVPEGFANGFLTLEDHTAVHYVVTEYYAPGAEHGIRFDDPTFNIKWPMKPAVVSEKDRSHPLFAEKMLIV